MMKKSFLVFSAVMVVLASVGFAFTGVASAHNAEDSYVYVNVTETSLNGRVDYPFGDLREALGFRLDGSEEENVAELVGRVEDLRFYADEHLDIRGEGQNYELTFGDVEFLFEDNPNEEINYVIIPYTAEITTGTVPRVLDVTFDPFFELSDDNNALLLVQNDWKAGIYDNGEGQDGFFTFNSDAPRQTIDLGEPSGWKNFTASFSLGLDHIRTGPDHILFICVLLLPSVLVFSLGGWKPADSFGRSLWRILKIATMFTVAHSITFTLAGLDILPLPSAKVTETIIALSIAAAALHNLRPIFPNKEWIIAFGFGLFHGMGFASLVSGLEVDRRTQLVSLLGRNVGIEVGQVGVILVMFGLLYLLRNTVLYRWVLTIGSVVLALVASVWMIERLFETDFGTNDLVEVFIRVPRSVYVIAVLTAIAGVYQIYERRRDGLVDSVDIPTIDLTEEAPDERSLVEV